MTDPKRWRDGEEGAAVVALIDALRADEPSVEAREALWAKLAPMVPPGGSGSGTGGGGGSGSAIGAKAIGLGIGAIGIVTIVAWIATRPPPTVETPRTEVTPSASHATIVEAPPVESAPVIEAVEPTPSMTAVRPRTMSSAIARAVPSASSTSSASSSTGSAVDRLREEAEGVKRARQHLRDKNPGAALAELDRLAKLVPAGPLAEEREVLTIEALAASGDREGARRRAERFLFERPNSVHAARVRAFTER